MVNEKVKVEADSVKLIHRNSVTDTVQHLVQNIIRHIEPQGKLPSERQLVKMLGVTRSTLRESLKTLELLGVVQIRQGDGTYVSNEKTSSMFPKVISWGMLLNTTEARQLIEARLYLETSLAELAAIKSTENERAKLREILNQMKEKERDDQEFADFDSEFHLEIARSAKNPVLSSTLQNTKSFLQVWVERVVENSPSRNWVIEQHTQILEAIENQDAVAANEAMKAHLQEVTNRLLSSLDGAETG